MSGTPSPEVEVEEGSPIGGAECEESPEHFLHSTMEVGDDLEAKDLPVAEKNDDPEQNDDAEQNDGNLFPFDNLAVEFYEGPDETADSSGAQVQDPQICVDDESTTDMQDVPEGLDTLSESANNVEDSSKDGEFSDNSKSNITDTIGQDIDEETTIADSSDLFEPNVEIKEELMDTDYKELQKTYIENFIYSSAPASFDETSNSMSDEVKGSPLSRFPKIVKAVERADYGTLQVLYQLLYQRSAWDTQELVKQGILEFSGFSFNKNSEEYFNREVTLRTLPNDMLVKIGALLGLDQMKSVLGNIDKSRHNLISSIMDFLSRPRKRSRITKSLVEQDNKNTHVNAAGKCGCRNHCFDKFTKKEKEELLTCIEIIRNKSLLDSYMLTLMHVKKVPRKPGDESKKLKEVLYNYKTKIGNKDIQVCKGAFVVLHGLKMGKVNKLQNKLKSGNLPPEIKAEDLPPGIRTGYENLIKADFLRKEGAFENILNEEVKVPELDTMKKEEASPNKKQSEEDKLEEMKRNAITKVPKVLVQKVNLDDINSNKDVEGGKDEAEESKESYDDKKSGEMTVKISSEDKKSDEMTVKISSEDKKSDAMIVKLKDFPLVVRSIENAPEELLIDMHYLLFLNSADVSKVKENILEFSGFTFGNDTEEYDERNEFLQRMSNKIVAEVARSFSLAVLSNKEETIKNILAFLTKPDESYLRTTGSVPVILSDVELDDIEDMTDSDESITCEVVQKKVECIDLISSGEESDGEGGKVRKKSSQKGAKTLPKVESPKPTGNSILLNSLTGVGSSSTSTETQASNESQNTTDSSSNSQTKTVRTLRDFETICKIVNTHPHEYLVDIFDLLYLRKHEPSTLRSDILDFSGFTFEKGSPDYIKRKQLLDRMLYNSVRRIYNTLIHNTTEVKVFSKPTMITEIFQFLFKLPDTDTSVRPPPVAKPVTKTNLDKGFPALKNVPAMGGAVTPPGPLPNQSGKLSDLKRVFQRVACFPCEYLIDVHKLLFMTDCDPKVIRQNIFGFKGFSFGTDSPEFQQRKMYLEYLTFHSLRKISSVLTTRSVDLRNSTKHELATHLTQVLAEYCNTFVETEPIGTSSEATAKENQKTTTNSTPTSSDPNVENIVVTPIIENLNSGSTVTSSESKSSTTAPVTSTVTNTNTEKVSSEKPKQKESSEKPKLKESSEKPKQKEVVSSTTLENTPPLAISIVDTRSIRSPATTTTPSSGSRKRKSTAKSATESKKSAAESKKSAAESKKNAPPPQADTSQFADINLPEIEQYRQLYGQNLNIYSQNMSPITGLAAFGGSGVVPQTFPHIVPQTLPFPLVHPYPQPLQVQSPFQTMQQPSQVLGLQTPHPAVINQVANKPTEVIVPGECVLSDVLSEEPTSKKQALGNSIEHDKPSKKVCLSSDEALSLHSKIRDAMDNDDEEDCDKPLASLIGHPIDSVIKKHICDIVENTDLQDITINGVIQKIYNMYPKFDLSYRKEFIKSTLRSILYRLGERKNSEEKVDSRETNSPDCSVTTTDNRDSPMTEPLEAGSES